MSGAMMGYMGNCASISQIVAFDLVNPSSGATTWTDSTSGVYATVVGSPVYDSAFGGGLTIASNCWVEVQGVNTKLFVFTISIVANVTAGGSHYNPFFDGSTAARTGNAIWANINNVTWSTGINGSTVSGLIFAATGVAWWDFVYNGTSVKVYKNGTPIISGTTSSANIGWTNNLRVGTEYGQGATSYLNGKIYRIKYQTAALDQTGVVSQFNTYKNTYGLNAGSIQFSGSNYISSTTSTSPTAAFTIEAWIYPTATSQFSILSIGNEATSRIVFFTNNGNISYNIYGSASVVIAASGIAQTTWQHVAIVRNASNLITVYVNGVSKGTATLAGTLGNTGGYYIAGDSTGAGLGTGYISNLRYITGVALYVGAFTPPTAMLNDTQVSGTNTALLNSGTQLLLNTCNGSNFLVDSSGKGVVMSNNGTVVTSNYEPFTPYPIAFVTTGIQLHLDAGNASSYPGTGSTWTDLVGNKTFTLSGSPSYSSSNGGYLNFVPASSQYAYSATSLSVLSTWTVEVWHYYTGTNAGTWPSIVTESFANSVALNYNLGSTTVSTDNTSLTASYFNSSSWKTSGDYSLTANNWYHIVGTYDGTTLKLYVNNSLVKSNTISGNPSTDNQGIRLMRRWDAADYWGGRLSIVRIYNNDIGATSVTQNWNSQRSRFGL